MIELPGVPADLLAALPARQRRALERLARLAGPYLTLPGSTVGENAAFSCAMCGGPCEQRAYRGGRRKRYCSRRCRDLGWCRNQLERAGYRVERAPT